MSGRLAFTAGSGLGLLLWLESDFLSTLDLHHAGCVNRDFHSAVLEIPHRIQNRLFHPGGSGQRGAMFDDPGLRIHDVRFVDRVNLVSK
jgi:hypothetical protein